MSVHYYIKNDQITTSNDIKNNRNIPLGNRCDNVYLAQSPMGVYFDLGAATIGGRPVFKSYEVGDPTYNTPINRVISGKFECYQPCWGRKCK